MKEDLESSLRPAIYWMKLTGIQMNVSGKNRFICRCIVSVIGLAILCIEMYLFLGSDNLKILKENLVDEADPVIIGGRSRKEKLLWSIPEVITVFRSFERGLLSYFIIYLGSLTRTWRKIWSDLQDIQVYLQLDATFHRKLRKECYVGIGLFTLEIALGTANLIAFYPKFHHLLIVLPISFFMILPGLSVLILFYILVSAARLLIKKLDESIEKISEKTDNTAAGSEDDDLSLSMELGEWRHQYDLVSRWIDRLDSCFGFLIFVQLVSFTVYSFYYFWILLQAHPLVAIHVRHDVYAMRAYGVEIEQFIGRSLLDSSFPLGDAHILNFLFFCERSDRFMPTLVPFLVDQTISWLRFLIILIPIFRMQNQDAGLFETFRQFKSRLEDSPLQLQLHNLRLQVLACPSSITAIDVITNIGPPILLAVIAATIEFGLTLYEIVPIFRSYKDLEPSIELLYSSFANKTLMYHFLKEELARKNQTNFKL